MRKLALVFVCLLSTVGLYAQGLGTYPYVKVIPNDTSTGTTQFTLTKLTSSGQAVIMATTDTSGYEGICVANCGTNGSALIAVAGLVPVKVDGTTTAQHYIVISSSTGGDGSDSGSTTWPNTATDVVGQVQTASTGGGSFSMVDLGVGKRGSTTTLCSGTLTLGTTLIASGAAASTVTATCTGLASTDNILLDFNGSPLAVTGYIPSANGMLAIIKWPTSNTINVSVVNNTASSITPGSALTLNYRVIR